MSKAFNMLTAPRAETFIAAPGQAEYFHGYSMDITKNSERRKKRIRNFIIAAASVLGVGAIGLHEASKLNFDPLASEYINGNTSRKTKPLCDRINQPNPGVMIMRIAANFSQEAWAQRATRQQRYTCG